MKINKEELIEGIQDSWPAADPPRRSSQKPEKVDHPTHYNCGKHETIDVIEDWSLGFHCGNAVKYIARHKYKGEAKQDIKKAIWYLKRYLEKL